MRYGRGHKELVPLHLNLAAIDTISQKIQNEEEEGIIKSMALAFEYTLLRNQIVEMLVVVVVVVRDSVRDDIIDVM